MTSVNPVSRHSPEANYKPVTWGNVVSEGGLELSLSGTHRASPGDSQTRSDLRASVAPSHPALIREHPESSAPVSREVSPAMLTTLLPSGPAAAFVAP